MKTVLFLLLSTFTMLGQTPLSLNVGGGIALNFNTPLSTVSPPFKVYTNYISPNIIIAGLTGALSVFFAPFFFKRKLRNNVVFYRLLWL